MIASVHVFGPFKVVGSPLTLQPKGLKPATAPDNGLPDPVAWWKFDETEGMTAADASGHRLDSRLQGKAGWAPDKGRRGGALELDGATGFIDCAGVDELNFQEGMAVAAWFKVRANDKKSAALITKGSDTWRLQWQGDKGRLHFALTGPQLADKKQSRSVGVDSKRALDDGQWHHVTGLYDGKRVALYVDGVLEDSVAATGLIVVNTEPVWIGQNSAARGQTFNGWVDDVRLYRQGLSEKDALALYQSSAASAEGVK
jgi:large repetitive protein